MVNLRQIEIFHAVYQAGSVSVAARALGITQPTVSKVLKHAQDQMGFDLFRVVRGRLVPTEEAHLLSDEAAAIQARVESFNNATRNLRRGKAGHLRLAVLHSLGLKAVPTAIANFTRSNPGVSFDIKTVHSEEIVPSLYERSCDVAIAFDRPSQPRLNQTKLGSGELVVLYRRDDIVEAPARLSLAMLGHRCLIRLVNGGTVGALCEARQLPGPDLPSQIMVQTYFVAGALVREGAGVAIIDEFTAKAVLSPELDYRPLAGAAPFDVYEIHREDHPPSRVATAFMSAVREALAA
ncbi:MAG: LysR family transcriptional regulator [Caulobacteraceae bacterium]